MNRRAVWQAEQREWLAAGIKRVDCCKFSAVRFARGSGHKAHNTEGASLGGNTAQERKLLTGQVELIAVRPDSAAGE